MKDYPKDGLIISRVGDGYMVKPVDALDNRRWYFDTRAQAWEWVQYLERQELQSTGQD